MQDSTTVASSQDSQARASASFKTGTTRFEGSQICYCKPRQDCEAATGATEVSSMSCKGSSQACNEHMEPLVGTGEQLPAMFNIWQNPARETGTAGPMRELSPSIGLVSIGVGVALHLLQHVVCNTQQRRSRALQTCLKRRTQRWLQLLQAWWQSSCLVVCNCYPSCKQTLQLTKLPLLTNTIHRTVLQVERVT